MRRQARHARRRRTFAVMPTPHKPLEIWKKLRVTHCVCPIAKVETALASGMDPQALRVTLRRTAMDRHRRITRTLACLVLSMTVGAAVLDWFQPDRIAGQVGGPALVALLRDSISEPTQADAEQRQWRVIRIDPQHGDAAAGARSAHIVIDHDGRWAPTENWRNQQPLHDAETLCIGLRASADSNVVTPDQWRAMTMIVRTLQQMCRIPGQAVVLNDTLAPPPDAGTPIHHN